MLYGVILGLPLVPNERVFRTLSCIAHGIFFSLAVQHKAHILCCRWTKGRGITVLSGRWYLAYGTPTLHRASQGPALGSSLLCSLQRGVLCLYLSAVLGVPI